MNYFTDHDVDYFLQQARDMTADHLDAAVAVIDRTFSAGYAKQHPELVGAFIRTTAAEGANALTTQFLMAYAESTRKTIDLIASSLEELAAATNDIPNALSMNDSEEAVRLVAEALEAVSQSICDLGSDLSREIKSPE